MNHGVSDGTRTSCPTIGGSKLSCRWMRWQGPGDVRFGPVRASQLRYLDAPSPQSGARRSCSDEVPTLLAAAFSLHVCLGRAYVRPNRPSTDSKSQFLAHGAPTLSLSIEIAVCPSASHVESGAKSLGVPASYIKPGHCAYSYKGKDRIGFHGGQLQTPSMDSIRQSKPRHGGGRSGLNLAIDLPVRSCSPFSERRHSSPPAVMRRST